MKTIHQFFIATLLVTLSANAQITKGNWMVGGSGNLTTYKSEYKSNSQSSISSETSGKGISLFPNIGHFIFDKFAVGLTPSYGYFETENSSGSSFGIGSFARYYFLKPDNRVNLLSQVSYSYFQGENTNGNNYIIKAGPTIFFNESAALEITLDYNSNISKDQNSVSKVSSFNIGIGLQIHLKK
jgi:hypothetical protein